MKKQIPKLRENQKRESAMRARRGEYLREKSSHLRAVLPRDRAAGRSGHFPELSSLAMEVQE